jgi:hypothetical protein
MRLRAPILALLLPMALTLPVVMSARRLAKAQAQLW